LLFPPELLPGVGSPCPDLRVGLLSSISRADLAAFVVREIVSPVGVGKVMFIRGE